MYFKSPDAEPVWVDHLKLRDYWLDHTIPIKYYPENDFMGNKKPYKELPLQREVVIPSFITNCESEDTWVRPKSSLCSKVYALIY